MNTEASQQSTEKASVGAERLELMEGVFRALADPTRLGIVAILARGDICVCDIYSKLGISQPKASRHLAYLRRAGLAQTQRRGLWVYYRLAEPADPVLKTLLTAVVHALGHVAGDIVRDPSTPPGTVLARLKLECCCG